MLDSLSKNIRFLGGFWGHILPVRTLQRLMGFRYPDFAGTRYDLCIEGVQRSGNTFFVALFQHWNPGTSVAHHTHLAATVRYSVRSGIPAVVLIRPPADAIASLIIWDSKLSDTVAILSYLLYHHLLWRRRKRFLTLGFDDVVARPDQCIRQINQHFATAFQWGRFTPEVELAVAEIIREQDSLLQRQQRNSSLPNAVKEQAAAEVKQRLQRNILFPPAQRIYRAFSEQAAVIQEVGPDAE